MGKTFNDGCSSSNFSEDSNEEYNTPIVPRDKIILWHKKLVYTKTKGQLRALHGKGMVKGIFGFSLDFYFYEHCMHGKHNRMRFPFGSSTKKWSLELYTVTFLGMFLFHH